MHFSSVLIAVKAILPSPQFIVRALLSPLILTADAEIYPLALILVGVKLVGVKLLHVISPLADILPEAVMFPIILASFAIRVPLELILPEAVICDKVLI